MLKKTAVLFLTVFISSLLIASISYPQNFERGIREIERDVRGKVEKKLERPPKKSPPITEERKIEKKEGPAYLIKKINLSGCESVPPDEFMPIIKEYENKELTFGDLDELCQKIERAYIARGFIASCFVPPQEVKNGEVAIYAVEAKMGELEIRPHKYFNNKMLKRYWRIKGGSPLVYDKISYSLQQMNRNSDREVKAVLHAGKKKDTTDVILDVDTHFPIHPTFSFNREGAAPTGRPTIGFGGRHSNFLNLDDTLFSGYTHTQYSDNVYAYHMLPITQFGTNLLYGFSRSDAFPKLDFEQYDLRSYAKGISAFVHQDLYDKDNYLADLYIGVDGRDQETYTDTGLLHRDRLRVLRIGTKVVLKTPATVIFITPELSQGLDILGARRESDVSSRNSGDTFSKFTLEMQVKHSLNVYTMLNIKGDIQLASEKLAPQEEFAFGGINSVRGYAYGDYYGDAAVQANVELLCKPAFLPDTIKLPFDKKPLKECITGLIFFDYGYGTRRGDIQGEKTKDKLASVGTGVRFNLYDQVSLRLEAGFPISLGDIGITEGAQPRLHIVLEFEDKMLDKIANRICR